SSRAAGAAALTIASASSSNSMLSALKPAGSSVGGGVTSEPCDQLTSARRRLYEGQSSGHRHGASGARSSSHIRATSPLAYVRLWKCLHSSRMATPPWWHAGSRSSTGYEGVRALLRSHGRSSAGGVHPRSAGLI